MKPQNAHAGHRALAMTWHGDGPIELYSHNVVGATQVDVGADQLSCVLL